jgi:hypothetical protein
MMTLSTILVPIVPIRDLRPSGDGDTPSAACIPNINTEERRSRLRFGIVQLVITLIILTVMIITGISPLWRLLLFPFFSAAASGYFQWRDYT